MKAQKNDLNQSSFYEKPALGTSVSFLLPAFEIENTAKMYTLYNAQVKVNFVYAHGLSLSTYQKRILVADRWDTHLGVDLSESQIPDK